MKKSPLQRNWVIPKSGLVIRDPLSKLPLPPEGKEVAMTPFWYRRLKDADVSIVVKEEEKKD